jgi:hypothetical protein
MDQEKGPGDEPVRIWYQSFVDPQEQSPYIERLKKHLDTVADAGFTFDVNGITPPDRYFHPASRCCCSRESRTSLSGTPMCSMV